MLDSATDPASRTDMSVQHDTILPPHFAVSESTPTILVNNIENKVEGKYDNGWEQDPTNPRNWSLTKKWIATSIVSYIFWGSMAGHQVY